MYRAELIGNKLLHDLAVKDRKKKHRESLKTSTAIVDCGPPVCHKIFENRRNLKREYLKKERYLAIDRDNYNLLGRMRHIMNRPTTIIGVGECGAPLKPSNQSIVSASITQQARFRSRNQKLIDEKNEKLANRLDTISSFYDNKRLAKEWEQTEGYFRRACHLPVADGMMMTTSNCIKKIGRKKYRAARLEEQEFGNTLVKAIQSKQNVPRPRTSAYSKGPVPINRPQTTSYVPILKMSGSPRRPEKTQKLQRSQLASKGSKKNEWGGRVLHDPSKVPREKTSIENKILGTCAAEEIFLGDTCQSPRLKIESYLYSTVLKIGAKDITIEVFTDDITKGMRFEATSPSLKGKYELSFSNESLVLFRKSHDFKYDDQKPLPPVEMDVRLAENIASRLRIQLSNRRLQLVLIKWTPSSAKEQVKKLEMEQEESNAAVQIQACFRGAKDRRKSKLKMEEKQEQIEEQTGAAVRIQARFRGAKDRRHSESLRQERESQVQTQAAMHIQSRVRGASGRKRLQELRNEREEQEKAAVHIQARFRGSKERRNSAARKEEREQEKAAVHIQARFRGSKERQNSAAWKGWHVSAERKETVCQEKLGKRQKSMVNADGNDVVFAGETVPSGANGDILLNHFHGQLHGASTEIAAEALQTSILVHASKHGKSDLSKQSQDDVASATETVPETYETISILSKDSNITEVGPSTVAGNAVENTPPGVSGIELAAIARVPQEHSDSLDKTSNKKIEESGRSDVVKSPSGDADIKDNKSFIPFQQDEIEENSSALFESSNEKIEQSSSLQKNALEEKNGILHESLNEAESMASVNPGLPQQNTVKNKNSILNDDSSMLFQSSNETVVMAHVLGEESSMLFQSSNETVGVARVTPNLPEKNMVNTSNVLQDDSSVLFESSKEAEGMANVTPGSPENAAHTNRQVQNESETEALSEPLNPARKNAVVDENSLPLFESSESSDVQQATKSNIDGVYSTAEVMNQRIDELFLQYCQAGTKCVDKASVTMLLVDHAHRPDRPEEKVPPPTDDEITAFISHLDRRDGEQSGGIHVNEFREFCNEGMLLRYSERRRYAKQSPLHERLMWLITNVESAIGKQTPDSSSSPSPSFTSSSRSPSPRRTPYDDTPVSEYSDITAKDMESQYTLSDDCARTMLQSHFRNYCSTPYGRNLTRDQFEAMMTDFSNRVGFQKVTDIEINSFMEAMDTDGNGLLDEDEWIEFMLKGFKLDEAAASAFGNRSSMHEKCIIAIQAAKTDAIKRSKIVHDIFKKYDVDDNGYLDANEMKAMIADTIMDSKIDSPTDEEIELFMGAMDQQKSGRVYETDIMKFFMGGAAQNQNRRRAFAERSPMHEKLDHFIAYILDQSTK